MWIKRPDDIKSSEITDETHYLDRRKFLAAAGVLGAASAGLLACSTDAHGSNATDDTA